MAGEKRRGCGCGGLIVGLVALAALSWAVSQAGKRAATSPSAGETDRASNPTPPVAAPRDRYADMAEYLAGAIGTDGALPSVSVGGGASLGVLRGRFRLLQVLGDAEMLVSELDEDAFVERNFLVRGVSTAGHVDGEDIGFGRVLFEGGETFRYTAAIGGPRTVAAVAAVDSAKISRAVADRLAALRAEIAPVEAEAARLSEYVRLRTILANYGPQAERSADAARRVEEAKARIAELGMTLDEDLRAQSERAKKLDKQIEAHRQRAARYASVWRSLP